MRYFFLILPLFIFMGCKAVIENQDENSTQVEKNMVIPAYFYDENLSQKVTKANLDDMIVIVNPNNGPGDKNDSYYTNFITNLVNAHKIPIGYVYTKYSNRNLDEVENDIDKWIKLYPKIKGFFIDEVSSNKDDLTYYKTLSDYIHQKGDYYIELNPGTMPDKGYFDISDSVVVYEDRVKYYDYNVCKDYPDKSAVIIYGANRNDMKNIIKNSNCKYYYITDDNLPNPYDSLPSYFDEEINELK